MIIASEFNKLSWGERERKKYFCLHKDGFVGQMSPHKRPYEYVYWNDKALIEEHGPITLYIYVKPKKGI